MKYLKKFSTEAEREAATLTTPNVSEVVQSETTHYDRAWSTPVNVITQTIEEYVYVDASLEQKNVNFWDYDGVLKYSYTDTEFLALSAMPENPCHPGLVAQGWNWSLTNAKAYVTKYRYLEIGQQYTTTDGHTRIYITIPENFSYMEFRVVITRDATMASATTDTVKINWGDGSNVEEWQNRKGSYGLTHTYATSGDYIIEIYSTDAIFHLGGTNDSNSTTTVKNSSYYSLFGDVYYDTNVPKIIAQLNCVTKVEFGDNVLAYCPVGFEILETVTTNKYLTYTKPTPWTNNVHRYKSNLKAAIYPQNIDCYCIMGQSTAKTRGSALKCICFSDQSTAPTFFNEYILSSCPNIKHLTLPEWSTWANNNAITNNINLEVLILPDTAASQFANWANGDSNTNLKHIHFPASATSVVATRNPASLEELELPSTITSIPTNFMDYCCSLKNLYIPEGVTSIGNSAFPYNNSLRYLSLPTTITSMGNSCFVSGTSLGIDVWIYATTPPTLGTTAFTIDARHLGTIHVPPSTLNDYQTATNWASFANYMEEMTQAEYTAYCTEHNIENE